MESGRLYGRAWQALLLGRWGFFEQAALIATLCAYGPLRVMRPLRAGVEGLRKEP